MPPPAARRRPARPAVLAPITLHEFDALDRTHADIVQTLKQLESLIERIDSGGIDDQARASAGAICAFFDGAARAHHDDEERVVFPPLLAGGDGELVQHVQRLQQDHGWIEEDWLELRPLLNTIAEGHGGHDPVALRQMCEVFCTLYVEHIALEESLIYPEAKRRLAEESVSRGHRIEGDAS